MCDVTVIILKLPLVCTIRVAMPVMICVSIVFTHALSKGLSHVYFNPNGTLKQGSTFQTENRSSGRSRRALSLMERAPFFSRCFFFSLHFIKSFEPWAKGGVSQNIELKRRYCEFLTWLNSSWRRQIICYPGGGGVTFTVMFHWKYLLRLFHMNALV